MVIMHVGEEVAYKLPRNKEEVEWKDWKVWESVHL